MSFFDEISADFAKTLMKVAMENFYKVLFGRGDLVKGIDAPKELLHYTSADAALKIIKTKELWMRSAETMNDLREIRHGFETIFESLKRLKLHGDMSCYHLGMNFYSRLVEEFKNFMSKTPSCIYILCFSEESKGEENNGRLSMWRAYGGEGSKVAFSFNVNLIKNNNVTFLLPATYLDEDKIYSKLILLLSEVKKLERDAVDPNTVLEELISSLVIWAVCLKHPAFKEEREWRLVYTLWEDGTPFNLQDSEVLSVNGVPQIVMKASLREHSKEFNKFMDGVINKILIGPSDFQETISKALESELTKAGLEDSYKYLKLTQIPLRL